MVRPPRYLASHVFNVVSIAIGLVVVAWMLGEFGAAGVHRLATTVGWWFAVIAALDLITLSIDAAAVHAFMRPEARMVSYWRVLAAQASGVATNLITPGGKLGEATKVTMLIGHAPRGRAVSSVVQFNVANLYLSVLVLAVGVPLTLALVDLPRHVEVVAAAGTAVFVAVVIAISALVNRGAIASMIDALAGLRMISPNRATDWKTRSRDVDTHVRELHTRRGPGTRRGIALVCMSRALGLVTVTVTLHAIGLPLTAPAVIGILSVGIVVSWVSNLVPLGIGVSEGGHYALFAALAGAPFTGLGYALINRARSLVLAALGFVVMLVMHTINRVVLARQNARRTARAELLHPPAPASVVG